MEQQKEGVKTLGFLVDDVWVVGQLYGNVNLFDDEEVTEICAWDIVGIFSTKLAAVKACKTKCHFIFTIPINVDIEKDKREIEEFWPFVG